MGLNFTPLAVKVEFPGGDITVRGLGLEELTLIVREHGGPLGELFSSVAQGEGQVSLTNIGAIVTSIMETAPGAVAVAICLAADLPLDQVPLVKQIPGPAQIDILTKISEMTFGSDGLPRALEMVISIASGTTSLIKKIRS